MKAKGRPEQRRELIATPDNARSSLSTERDQVQRSPILGFTGHRSKGGFMNNLQDHFELGIKHQKKRAEKQWHVL